MTACNRILLRPPRGRVIWSVPKASSKQDEQDLQDKNQNSSVSHPAHPVNPVEKSVEKRTAIFIGPEFCTVSRSDLVSAASEAGDAGFDVLIACVFNYNAHSSELDKLGRNRTEKDCVGAK